MNEHDEHDHEQSKINAGVVCGRPRCVAVAATTGKRCRLHARTETRWPDHCGTHSPDRKTGRE